MYMETVLWDGTNRKRGLGSLHLWRAVSLGLSFTLRVLRSRFFLLRIMSREGWLLNSDPNYLWNALWVSISCGITETLTISNYDNYTIFAMGILSYYYVHWSVCEQTLDCLLFSTT